MQTFVVYSKRTFPASILFSLPFMFFSFFFSYFKRLECISIIKNQLFSVMREKWIWSSICNLNNTIARFQFFMSSGKRKQSINNQFFISSSFSVVVVVQWQLSFSTSQHSKSIDDSWISIDARIICRINTDYPIWCFNC